MITPVKLWRKIKEKRGFTLAEVIIASSIFVVVSTIGVTVFVNVLRIQRRITLENAIYEDGRFVMERIAREIRQNTIDYEEYYRADTAGPPQLLHGQNFGCYAQRFYNPGTPALIGAKCNDGSDPAMNPGCVINKNTLDVNTGENPYSGSLDVVSTDANALCDKPNHTGTDCSLGGDEVNLEQQQLYLINPAGTEKTYLGWKDTGSGEHAVAMLKLTGQDVDTDGIAEEWVDIAGSTYYATFCNNGFSCPPATLTDLDYNLAGTDNSPSLYDGFVPLTPLRTDITRLSFFISPVEDPRKAFAETTVAETTVAEAIQQQPHVTVVMTLKPSESELSSYVGDPPEVTIQATIGSRTYNEVKSYLGVESCT